MGDEKQVAMAEHETWLRVWKLVERLDGEIRYSPKQHELLLKDSAAIATLVRSAVLRSQERLNEALIGEDS